jgi:hypothetical protein
VLVAVTEVTAAPSHGWPTTAGRGVVAVLPLALLVGCPLWSPAVVVVPAG